MSGGEGSLSTGLRLSLSASPVSGIAFETLEKGRGVGQGIGRSCSVSWCQESRHNSPLLLSSLETSSLSRSLTFMEAALGSSAAALPQGPIPTGCLQMPAQPEGRAPGRACEAQGSRTPELYFPTLLLAGESSAGAPHPIPPQHPAFPVQLHPSPSPQSKECAQDTVGLVPNPLLAHFTQAFTNWPLSHGCCLSFGSKGADRGPSSPQFLMLHFAPAPLLQKAVPRRVKEPWGGGRVPWTPVLPLRHQALW